MSNPFDQFGYAPNPFDQFGFEDEENARDQGFKSDLVASFGIGANQLLGTVGDIYGLVTGDMDNMATRQSARGVEFYKQFETPELAQKQEQFQAYVDEGDGELDKFGRAVWGTVTDLDLLTNFVVKQIPMTALTGGLGRGAAIATNSLKAGTGVAVGSGATLQGGDIGGGLYDDLLKLPDEIWDRNPEFAGLAQEVGREQAKADIALEAARKAAAISTSLSAATAGILPNTVEKGLVRGISGDDFLSRGVKGFVGESIQESIEEGGGQIASNFAAQPIDAERGLFEGVGQAVGQGGLLGGVIGGAVGVLSPVNQARENSERARNEAINNGGDNLDGAAAASAAFAQSDLSNLRGRMGLQDEVIQPQAFDPLDPVNQQPIQVGEPRPQDPPIFDQPVEPERSGPALNINRQLSPERYVADAITLNDRELRAAEQSGDVDLANEIYEEGVQLRRAQSLYQQAVEQERQGLDEQNPSLLGLASRNRARANDIMQQEAGRRAAFNETAQQPDPAQQPTQPDPFLLEDRRPPPLEGIVMPPQRTYEDVSGRSVGQTIEEDPLEVVRRREQRAPRGLPDRRFDMGSPEPEPAFPSERAARGGNDSSPVMEARQRLRDFEPQAEPTLDPEVTYRGATGSGFQTEKGANTALRSRQNAQPEYDWQVVQGQDGAFELFGRLKENERPSVSDQEMATEAAPESAVSVSEDATDPNDISFTEDMTPEEYADLVLGGQVDDDRAVTEEDFEDGFDMLDEQADFSPRRVADLGEARQARDLRNFRNDFMQKIREGVSEDAALTETLREAGAFDGLEVGDTYITTNSSGKRFRNRVLQLGVSRVGPADRSGVAGFSPISESEMIEGSGGKQYKPVLYVESINEDGDVSRVSANMHLLRQVGYEKMGGLRSAEDVDLSPRRGATRIGDRIGDQPESSNRRQFVKRLTTAAVVAATGTPTAKLTFDAVTREPAVRGKAQVISEFIDQPMSETAVARLRDNDLEGAIDDIIASAPEDVRRLAESVKSLLPAREAYRVEVMDGTWGRGNYQVNGEVDPNPESDGRIRLRLMPDTGNTATVLHEAMHLAIMGRYSALSRSTENNYRVLGISPEQGKEAVNQWNSIYKEYRDLINAKRDNGEEVTGTERIASSDPDELFVRSLTDRELQQKLYEMNYNGKTLMQRFKDWVKKHLFGGDSGVTPTWLDAAISGAQDVMDASAYEAADFSFNNAVLRQLEKQNTRAAASNEAVASDEVMFSPRRARPNATYGDFQAREEKDGSIVVFGEPETIRAQLGDTNIRGRVVDGGLTFTRNMAPRVSAMLKGEQVAYSRGGKVTKHVIKDGKYVGAPERFNTPGKIAKLRKTLEQLAMEGDRGRFWYENSGEAILQMTGGNVDEAKKFIALLAIYSPQAKVDANSTFALRAWSQYKAGQPITVKTGNQNRQATEVLYEGKAWGGEKTNNFYTNLLREVEGNADRQGATIDMWMMRAAQYNTDAPNDSQYAFMEIETNRLAQKLGWEPQQVQAAIWVGMKARQESKVVKQKTEEISERNGWITFERNAKGKRVRKILDAPKHRMNWIDRAMEHDVTEDDTLQAKFDFSDGVRRHIGQISWEARPSTKSNTLQGIHSAPYEQQLEFQLAIQDVLYDSEGNDRLAKELGLLEDGTDSVVPGYWEGEVSPSQQTQVSMSPARGADGKKSIDPAQKSVLDTYAALMGYILQQDGVGYHRPFYKASKRDSHAAELVAGRAFTPEEAAELGAAFESVLGEGAGAIGLIATPSGMRVVDFAERGHKEFGRILDQVAEVSNIDADVERVFFAFDGNLVEGDWEGGNGENYINTIREAGRSDLLGWASDNFAQPLQEVYNDFAERYGWGDPGNVQERLEAAASQVTDSDVDLSPRRAPQPTSVDTALGRIRDALAGREGQALDDAGITVVMPDAVPRERRGSLAFAVQAARAFQKSDVVNFVEFAEGVGGFNGATVGGQIFIDVNAEQPYHIVLGHELTHVLKRDYPDLYQQLEDLIIPQATAREESARQHGFDMDSEKGREEYVSDVVGNRFGETEFWRAMAEANPKGFRVIAQVARSLMTKLADFFRMRSINSGDGVQDLNRVRSEIAKVMNEYRNRINEDAKGPIADDQIPSFMRTEDTMFSPRRSQQNVYPLRPVTETLADKFIRTFQDKMVSLKRTQQAIVETEGRPLDPSEDPYLAEELFYGKTEEDLRQIEVRILEPFIEDLTRSGITVADLDKYLIARHAPERNAYIASINPDMQDGGSGMTNAEAAQVIRDVQQSGKQAEYDRLANGVYEMTQLTRDLIRSGGLETDEVVSSWQNQYQNYVPLRGFAEEQIEAQAGSGTGRGFDIRGREARRALGRESLAKSPTSQVMASLTEKVIRNRKNEVGKTFLNLVENHPDPAIWEVFTDDNPDMEQQFRNGQVSMGPVDMARSDKYFAVKRDGKVHYVKIKDQRLLNAMQNVGPSRLDAVTRVVAPVTRFLASVNTAYNPQFVATNFVRDIQTAAINLAAEATMDGGKLDGNQIAGRVVRNTPKAIAAIRAANKRDAVDDDRDPEASEYRRYYQEFLNDGAKTGYFDSPDVDRIAEGLEKRLRMTEPGSINAMRRGLNDVIKITEKFNSAVENGVRLSAYIEARKAGVDRKQAASLAKNMTVNFNRKGEAGSAINSWYMFFNAAVQGTSQFLRTLSPLQVNNQGNLRLQRNMNLAQKIAGGITASSIGFAALMRDIGGEDDDGEAYWDKIPPAIRERNLIIMKPGTKGDYYKFPLPYGYNFFWNLGDSIDGAIRGSDRRKDNILGDLVSSFTTSFSPFSLHRADTASQQLLLTASPSIAVPVSELATNTNFFGENIMRENFPGGAQKARAAMYFPSTKEPYVQLAKFLNESLGGGSEYRSGELLGISTDFSPDAIQQIVEYAGGGLLRTVTGTSDTLMRRFTGRQVEAANVPFARTFVGKDQSDYGDMDTFYDRRQEIINARKEYMDAPDFEAKKASDEGFRGVRRLYPLANSTEKALKRLRDREDRVRSNDRLTPRERDDQLKDLRERKDDLVDRFNRRYNEMMAQ